ncbi:hypothetical protein [Arthrobacter sp. Soil764]|uniref:hypothetical protein n=1 Tax=Arthrobacter sp. Soil764 TaxID=1736403 RepID=UPI001910AB3F|nr:hypothetical protein [Arthrobacter sp. Soil764]
MEIIDEILNDAGPGGADVRESLRRHVANNPGQPEKALLMHMLTVRRSCQDQEDGARRSSSRVVEGRKQMDCESVQQQEIQRLNNRFHHAGVTLWELWLRYYSLGGEASEHAVAAHLRGELALSGLQQQVLHMALNELDADEAATADIGPFAAAQMGPRGHDPAMARREDGLGQPSQPSLLWF